MNDPHAIMPVEWLEPQVISAYLTPPANELLTITVERELESTNDTLMAMAREHDVHGQVLLAECQRAGRGRNGRAWVSPMARNLYLTIAWHLELEVSMLSGLSLAVGAAIAAGLQRDFGCDLELKWPNDIYAHGKKLGGILVEIVQRPGGELVVLVGVGLNVAMSHDSGHAIDQPWSDLAVELGYSPSRNEVAGCVLQALFTLLSTFSSTGFAGWRTAWSDRDMLRGRSVTIDAASVVHGVAAGVNEDGALLVQTNTGMVPVYGGDATLRKE